MILLSFDPSLSCTGFALFENCKPILVNSIPTNSKADTPKRLRAIWDSLEKIKTEYQINQVAIEGGFSRFSRSTEQIYRVHGIINLLFCEIPQTYYPPTKIKKLIAGSAKAEKKEVAEAIKNKYFPELSFKCFDESDAVAVGIVELIDKNLFYRL